MKTVQTPRRQRGVTLIELMVGLSIGLLVVTVAMGALLLSRGVSGTVSDATGIQQQGAYILRTIGQQLRQAGSLYLNPDPAGIDSTNVLGNVVFETEATANGGNSFAQQDTLSGDDNSLTTGFRRYQENVFLASNAKNADNTTEPPTPSVTGTDFLARNCVGAPASDGVSASSKYDKRIESVFTFADNALRCHGNSATTPQPIAQNVAQFQVTYLVQTSDAAGAKVKYTKGSDMPAASDPAWRRVQGVQVCVVLYGSEPIDMPAGSSYSDCEGKSVDMTTLTGSRKNRMHLLFRNTFQLRSQGLI